MKCDGHFIQTEQLICDRLGTDIDKNHRISRSYLFMSNSKMIDFRINYLSIKIYIKSEYKIEVLCTCLKFQF